jgi:photosystem II stability/assembly factor-like uncharacterized protein
LFWLWGILGLELRANQPQRGIYPGNRCNFSFFCRGDTLLRLDGGIPVKMSDLRSLISISTKFAAATRIRVRRLARVAASLAFAIAAVLVPVLVVRAQQMPPELYSKLKWRLVGPFRAGRVTAVTGIPHNTAVYYIGTPGGGVWKTVDGGSVWTPIFDDAHVASIGDVAVARTNANIVYVGTGEQTPGNGMWKSIDAGATWSHIGLDQTHFISTVLVDPRNPEIVLVGALGDRTSGDQRGVFRTIDGGKSWTRTLYRDETSGVIDMSYDPSAPSIVFAAFTRRPGTPGAGGGGAGRGGTPPAAQIEIYKSVDAGISWSPLASTGLPASGLGRIGIVVAPGTYGQRVYVLVNQGVFRSDDSGATWQRATTDPRIVSSGYFGKIFANPRNPDDIFIGQTSMYRSIDGGHNWYAFNGAPSGDDFHVIWVNPENPQYMIQGVDQGAIVSEDGGKTWSTWYNQPTGQLYHITTDNEFPYMVYGSQQDSGTVGIPSRGMNGEITDNDRISIGGFEFSYIAVDPLNPNLIYSNSWYSSVVRFDRSTGQIGTVFIKSDEYREVQMAPLVYSPQDPHTLYLGTQYLLKTTDGGMTWTKMSPDLAPPPPPPPPPANANAPAGGAASGGAVGGGRGGGRGGAIFSLSPSTARGGVIWAGMSNGHVQLTQDGGKNWKDVSTKDLPTAPNGTPLPAVVQIIDASHFDPNTAYAALTFANNDGPLLYRTHDAGATWQKIVNGLPGDAITRFIREDTVRKGLLYAGTETSVWVSFDDGDHWQPLQLNLPITSMRDLIVHGNDLVLCTYGRSIYILDDISTLRQAAADILSKDAYLFRPSNAVRTRWDVNQDTPFPLGTTAGPNPPDGAIFDYFLKNAATGDMSLDILDSKGNLVRHYTSTPPPAPTLPANVPDYWFGPPAVLSRDLGATRFVWDLRYSDPDVLPYSYYGNILDYIEYTLADHAIPYETPRVQPQGPLAAPGNYAVVLTVNGQKLRQNLTVTMDSRVKATQADLDEQLAWAQKSTRGMSASNAAYWQLNSLIAAIEERQKSAASDAGLVAALKAAGEQILAVREGTRPPADAPPSTLPTPGIGPVNRDLSRAYAMIESGDMRPSGTAKASVQQLCTALDKDLDGWRQWNAQSLPALNAQLTAHQLAPLPAAANIPASPACGK